MFLDTTPTSWTWTGTVNAKSAAENTDSPDKALVNAAVTCLYDNFVIQFGNSDNSNLLNKVLMAVALDKRTKW